MLETSLHVNSVMPYFLHHAYHTPDAIAVTCGQSAMTYRQLDEKSNQLAHHLRNAYGVGEGALVGIVMERTEWLIVSMLAVLKAGAGFVPIDPMHRVRMAYIIEEAALSLLLTDTSCIFDVDSYNCALFAVDVQADTLDTSTDMPAVEIGGDSIAYVIYTSGTTGRPKGVEVPHRALQNYVNWLVNKFRLNNTDSSILLSSYAFDLGYTSLWGMLAAGGNLHLLQGEPGQMPEKIMQYLGARQVSFLKTTPSLFYMLLQTPDWKRTALSLRLVLLGGEPIRCADVGAFLDRYPDTVFVNHYGPTETTIGTISYTIDRHNFSGFREQPVIGSAITHNEVYILDAKMKLVPTGIAGEICIGGRGLAKGYLGSPALTADRFVPHPFVAGERLYRTGDYGKHNAAGQVIYLGRRDEQVKIKGYRIELNEVKQALMAHTDITDAVVITWEASAGNQQLVAYYTTSTAIDAEGLRRFLAARLPAYMVPVYLMPMAAFPLTANGKLDKKALPVPGREAGRGGRALITPANELESMLVNVWEAVLQRSPISTDDNFFEAGGDSIKAIQIAARMHQLHYQLEVKDIFQYPCIQQLAIALADQEQTGLALQQAYNGALPLSPIQRRFFELPLQQPQHYNQSVLLQADQAYSYDALVSILTALLSHHDMLRCIFPLTEQGRTAVVLPAPITPVLEIADLRQQADVATALTARATALQQSLVLEEGPLFKAGWYQLPTGYRLLLVVHHLVVDAVSWRILLEDIQTLSDQYSQGQALQLPARTASYAAWLEAAQARVVSPGFAADQSYWHGAAQQYKPALPLRSAVKPTVGSREKVALQLDEATTGLLTRRHSLLKLEINDVLLAALSLAAARTWGVRQLAVEMEGHGREDVGVQISRTVGWFTSKYPVLLDAGTNGLLAHIKQVKEMLRSIPHKGWGHLFYQYNVAPPAITGSPEISFNYLGQFTGASQETNGWKMAHEYAGDAMDAAEECTYALDITGMVAEGKLAVSFLYGPRQLPRTEIETLATHLRLLLLETAQLLEQLDTPQPTPSDFLYTGLSVAQVDAWAKQFDIEDIYPLSPMQEGMLFHVLVDRQNTAYFNQTVYRLKGALNIDAVKESLARLHQRHDILRTVFLHEKLDRPVQLVLKERVPEFVTHDLYSLPENQRESALTALLEQDATLSIDLARNAPMRVMVVKLAEDLFVFVWTYHHILKDGWSTGIIMADYDRFYESINSGQPLQLPPTRPFKAYLDWLGKQDKEQGMHYWQTYLQGYQQPVSLPRQHTGIVTGFEQCSREYYLDVQQTAALQAFAASCQVTFNTVLQALWGVLLMRYNNVDDVVFGVVVSGRPATIQGIESMVGLFINTIPLRVQTGEGMRFGALLQQLQQSASQSEGYHYHSLAAIQAGHPLKNQLFDHLFIFDNFPSATRLKGVEAAAVNNSLTVQEVTVSDHAHYDLALVAGVNESTLLKFDYNGLAFTASAIDEMAARLHYMIAQLLENPQLLVADLRLLPPAREQALAEAAMAGNVHAWPAGSVSSLFSDMALAHAQRTALVSPGMTLTYAQADALADQLAHYLRQQGIGRNDRVGILMERSAWVVISMLGAWKAGATFVPVDADCPPARLRHIVDDTALALLLVQSAQIFNLTFLTCPLFAVDIQLEMAGMPAAPTGITPAPEDIAYIIYTSGTTGQPKGVMVTHGGLYNYVQWVLATCGPTPDDSSVLLASYAFDLGYTAIWAMLCSGGALHLLPDNFGQLPEKLLTYMAAQQITFIKTTPSMLHILLQLDAFSHTPLSWRMLLVGGEPVNCTDLEQLLAAYPTLTCMNHYGPTETTIGTVAQLIHAGTLAHFCSLPVIGKPVTNNHILLLDAGGHLQPPGLAGEICVGGAGLAAGYWNQPALTVEKFIRHPYLDGQRLYRTGDYGYQLPDGRIVFSGRRDEQVKIRGHRIETGEVAAVLRRHAGVQDALVLPLRSPAGDWALAAYIVADASLQGAALAAFLQEYLPAYMVPAYFVHTAGFPLTPNGKIDRAALPRPSMEEHSDHFVAARDEVEAGLAAIWEKVLDKAPVGIHANFFALGGDSIKAVRLIGTINRHFDIPGEVKDVFEHPDICSFAAFMRNGQGFAAKDAALRTAAEAIAALKTAILEDPAQAAWLPPTWEDIYPMSDIQVGMLYRSSLHPEDKVYFSQVPTVFRDDRFDLAVFRKAIAWMVQKHPILRTSFDLLHFAQGMQVVHRPDPGMYAIHYAEIHMLPAAEQQAALQQYMQEDLRTPFQELSGYHWRIALFRIGEDSYLFLFSTHHALLDGWSDASFYTELSNVYYRLREHPLESPVPLKASYKDYIIDQWHYRQQEAVKVQWQQQLEGYRRSELPFHKTPSDRPEHNTALIHPFVFADADAARIEACAVKEQVAVKHVFLAALFYLVRLTTGMRDITLGVITNGRPDKEDADAMLGCFLNAIPFRVTLPKGMSTRELLHEVEQQATRLKAIEKLSLPEIAKAAGEDTTMVNPFFDIRYDYVDFHIERQLHQEVVTTQAPVQGRGNNDHLFSLFVRKTAAGYLVRFFIRPGLYNEAETARLVRYYQRIVMIMAGNPLGLATLPAAVMDGEELHQQVYAGNAGLQTGYPAAATLCTLFETQVRQRGDAIAVTSGTESLSYGTVNRMANQLAHYLQRVHAVDAGSRVGVMAGRSAMLPVLILGVLKAGAAYVPIDPGYPEARVAFTIADAALQVVLTDNQSSGTGGVSWVPVDAWLHGTDSEQDPSPAITPEALAYIIYTSGSTGQPKGAMITHANVVRLFLHDAPQFDFGHEDVWTLFHSVCFDFSVWEIFGALLSGGRLVVLPSSVVGDPARLLQLLVAEQVTVLNQVPAMFGYLSAAAVAARPSLNLRYVIFGGEALAPASLRAWHACYPQVKLVNMYGITETTVHVTRKIIDAAAIEAGHSNIGLPIPTLALYILDDELQVVPPGVKGELVVAGAGVCAGYLGQPELTAQRFIHTTSLPGEKLYRSGDMGYRQENGEIIFLGREDEQVKIRGYRIEIAEVTHACLQAPGVTQAVVMVKKENGNATLVAFVTGQVPPAAAAVRDAMSRRLPPYMVPGLIVPLETLPVTTNGKVDRRALLGVAVAGTPDDAYVAPRNPLEEQLCYLWAEVLQVPGVGVADNYFSLGGDSLQAIRLITRINKALRTQVALVHLFTHPTVAELAANLPESTGVDPLEEQMKAGYERIAAIRDEVAQGDGPVLPAYEDLYPLTPIESGMIYSSLLQPQEPVYYDQFTYQLQIGDMDRFVSAFRQLAAVHPTLRTRYYLSTYAMPVKLVMDTVDLPVVLEDIALLDTELQRTRIKEFLREDRDFRCNFEGTLLWHIHCFLLGNDRCFLVWNFHHAMLDGWSIAYFKTEVSRLLAATDQDTVALPALRHSYKDYCALVLGRQADVAAQAFWKQCLDGYSRNKLPFNFNGKKVSEERGARIIACNAGAVLLTKLEQLASAQAVSFKAICLSAYFRLLQLLCAETDIVTGVVSHDRPAIEDADRIMGCFLNTVPLRMDMSDIPHHEALLKKVNDALVAASIHELHLSDIAKAVNERSGADNPFFDCIFNFTDFHIMDTWYDNGLLSRNYDALGMDIGLRGSEMTNTLFDMEVSKTLGTFIIRIKYRPAYFDAANIELALKLYLRILECFTTPQWELHSNDLLPDEVKHYLVQTFNDTVQPYTHAATLHSLFEAQVQRTPAAPALRQNGGSLTYDALNCLANRVAHALIAAGVKPGQQVGLIASRNFNMITGMLGILKTGAAYVPVDPEYPQERQQYILQHAGVAAVLADMPLPYEEHPVLRLDVVLAGDLRAENPLVPVAATNLAYTIYTSGSTGRPKGVMIAHHAAVNLVEWVNGTFGVCADDRLLFITSMCFDLSVYDIFGILAAGGCVVIATQQEVQAVGALKRLLQQEQITFWDSVPSTMNYLVGELEYENEGYCQEQLRLVFMSGDWIPVNLKDRLQRYFPAAQVISLGGATEGTVWSNYYPITAVLPHWNSIPYGKPVANNFFYILDPHRQLVPPGVVGELYIGGVGVANGYANDPEKTAAAFFEDPFRKDAGGRMYRTGDLGRLLPDGNMEFLGRRDHQVKIRGFRVETGEIEQQLLRHPAVQEAVVTVWPDVAGQPSLCAYVVSPGDIVATDLQQHLRASLPAYMIPPVVLQLEKIPLTGNGKIDRKALPQPTLQATVHTTPGALTALEARLEKIWRAVLHVPAIGAIENVFDLGTQSLQVAAFVNRVSRDLKVELQIREVFLHPTIQSLAALLEGKTQRAFATIPLVAAMDRYVLSPAQRRLWLQDQLLANRAAYNLAAAYTFHGRVDQLALSRAFFSLLERHEALRTVFVNVDGIPWQQVREASDAAYALLYRDLQDAADPVAAATALAQEEAMAPFDLEHGPLIRTTLLQIGKEDFVFLLTLHHIVADGWSMGVILREVVALYNAYAQGEGSPLLPLSLQYKDYAAWQMQQLEQEEMYGHRAYWLQQFAGPLPQLQLPYARPRPSVTGYKGGAAHCLLPPALLEQLHALARNQESTLYMLLLAAVNALLHHYSGQEDIIIGSPAAGRDHVALENQVGFYINTLAMRTRFGAQDAFETLLQKVKTVVLDAFAHQAYPFDQLVGELQQDRTAGRTQLFDVWMVLQQQLEEPDEAALQMQQVTVGRFANDFQVSRYDLRFSFKEGAQGLALQLNYSTDLFDHPTIAAMLNTFRHLLEAVASHTGQPLQALLPAAHAVTVTGKKTSSMKKVTRIERVDSEANAPSSVKKYFLVKAGKVPYVIEALQPGMDLESWLLEHQPEITAALLQYGGVLFRNFQVDGIPDFEKAVTAYGRELLQYDFASTPRTQLKGNIYTSTEYPREKEILMHNEMAYTNQYPRMVWFYCQQPASRDGETPLADARDIYRAIAHDTVQLFEQQGLLYLRNYHDQLDLPWQDVFRTDSREAVAAFCQARNIDFTWHRDGHLQTREHCPAVMTHPHTGEKVWFNQAHLFHSSSMEPALRKALRENFAEEFFPRNVFTGDGGMIGDHVIEKIKSVYEANKIVFPWQQSDVLLLDNLLTAHGRRPYEGNRSIVVAMTH